MTSPIVRMYATEQQARDAASKLAKAGFPDEFIVLVAQPPPRAKKKAPVVSESGGEEAVAAPTTAATPAPARPGRAEPRQGLQRWAEEGPLPGRGECTLRLRCAGDADPRAIRSCRYGHRQDRPGGRAPRLHDLGRRRPDVIGGAAAAPSARPAIALLRTLRPRAVVERPDLRVQVRGADEPRLDLVITPGSRPVEPQSEGPGVPIGEVGLSLDLEPLLPDAHQGPDAVLVHARHGLPDAAGPAR